MIFRLALRNILGGGLKTWLNVLVISLCYVVVIGYLGMIEGWNQEALRDLEHWEIGAGQFRHRAYDPYDPLTLQDSHAEVSAPLRQLIDDGRAVDLLISQAAIFPGGRMLNIQLKGIDPDQQVIDLPAALLKGQHQVIPLLIGSRMARDSGLREGDTTVLRWRDARGTFDAADARVVALMHTNVSSLDNGQAWLPIATLRTMLNMPGEATLVTLSREDDSLTTATLADPTWQFHDVASLTEDLQRMIEMKAVGGYVIFLILLSMALLAIFDTQVLSIFRRRREIGTMIALGMTRMKVIQLFTLEGAMFGLLATVAALIYGTPLLLWFAHTGLHMPEMTDTMGMVVAPVLYPIYGLGLLLTTTAVVLIAVTLVSFMPSRRIARLNPTDAIRGKLP